RRRARCSSVCPQTSPALISAGPLTDCAAGTGTKLRFRMRSSICAGDSLPKGHSGESLSGEARPAPASRHPIAVRTDPGGGARHLLSSIAPILRLKASSHHHFDAGSPCLPPPVGGVLEGRSSTCDRHCRDNAPSVPLTF